MPQPLALALDIGTSRTIAIAGRAREDGFAAPEIVAVAGTNTTGMRKGRISNFEFVEQTIRSVLARVEQRARADFGTVAVVCSGGDVDSATVERSVPLCGEREASGVVTPAAVSSLLEAVDGTEPPDGRVAIANARQYFAIDDRPEEIAEPVDMEGRSLRCKAIVAHMPSAHWDDIEDVVEKAGAVAEWPVFPPLAAGLHAVSRQRREDGVLCIDFGGGTTSWCAFYRNHPVAMGAIPVGGDHVTNDLLLAFRPGSTQAAENLKIAHGRALPDGVPRETRVPLAPRGEGVGDGRTAQLYAVSQVVSARMDETVRLVRSRLQDSGTLPYLGSGVAICGRASRLAGLPELVSRVFAAPCDRMTFVSGDSKLDMEPDGFAAAWGALRQAIRNDCKARAERAEKSVFRSFMHLFDR